MYKIEFQIKNFFVYARSFYAAFWFKLNLAGADQFKNKVSKITNEVILTSLNHCPVLIYALN